MVFVYAHSARLGEYLCIDVLIPIIEYRLQSTPLFDSELLQLLTLKARVIINDHLLLQHVIATFLFLSLHGAGL